MTVPRGSQCADHVYHQYVVQSDRRDALRSFLKANGVGTLIHYPVPVHMQPAYQGRVVPNGAALPHTERMCRLILSLPMHPQLTDAEVQEVGDLIVRWHRQSMDGR